MGLTVQPLIVKTRRRARKRAIVRFLVDSGAVYSLVPAKTLRRIGVMPHRQLSFVLADGTEVKRKVGDAYFEYRGQGGAAPVIFGEPGDEPLLGAVTLEALGLALDPFKRQLFPIRMMLASASRA
jgi:clan AA aspartic protease